MLAEMHAMDEHEGGDGCSKDYNRALSFVVRLTLKKPMGTSVHTSLNDIGLEYLESIRAASGDADLIAVPDGWKTMGLVRCER